MTSSQRIELATARRLAVNGALLGQQRPAPTQAGLLDVVKRLGVLQVDPTRTVERTHLLVLWSRLGSFDRAQFDELLAPKRRLFEVISFIVPDERLPELRFMARHFSEGKGAWQSRVREWMAVNKPLRRAILDQLRAEGPLPSRSIDGSSLVRAWRSSGWTHDHSVIQMLEYLTQRCEVAIAGRQGSQRLWDLAERVYPPATEELSAAEYARRRAIWIVRRTGLASLSEISQRVWHVERTLVKQALGRLTEEGTLKAAALERDGTATPVWIHSEAELERDVGRRTTLLSPFEPLIKDYERTQWLFGFRYRLEMYVPRDQRQYGRFVLPVLHQTRLVATQPSSTDLQARP